ncbi:VanZ family protein [Desulfosporosinus sp. PR]|uniref:VanZ family protein n=1 Tax=Candidatus Desulfosporosinus nitrosoreducens TaxID=3401928 RepID=UPI0027F18962|nr:VanZ family protein [Desulfosporosinus sp. PR]MDQ7097012.1 VanZ family protein [Desulfosporosinus sp. PR]
MELIICYIVNMLPYMMIAFPILLIVRVGIYLARKKQGSKLKLLHELGVAVFTLFMVGLASQTIIPLGGLASGRIGISMNSFDRINLIPFQSFVIIGRIFSKGGYPDQQIIQLLGNIGMFSVIGFMLPALWKKFALAKRAVRMCFCISLAIEVVQLFTGRSTDIDDLILNTFGGLLGFLLYAAIKKTIRYDV